MKRENVELKKKNHHFNLYPPVVRGGCANEREKKNCFYLCSA